MAHMSYCQFKNTLDDMKNCNEALGVMNFSDFEEMEESEQNAIIKLFTVCKDFIAMYKQSILPELNKE